MKDRYISPIESIEVQYTSPPTSPPLEREVEAKLVAAIKKAKGLCLKFVSPGNAGVPDRIVLLPGGVIRFVEVKRPGQKLRPIQKRWQEKLQRLGFACEVFDGT